MRIAKYNKPLTIVLTEEIYNFVKQETDQRRIAVSEWFRDAATLKIQTDQAKKGGINHEK